MSEVEDIWSRDKSETGADSLNPNPQFSCQGVKTWSNLNTTSINLVNDITVIWSHKVENQTAGEGAFLCLAYCARKLQGDLPESQQTNQTIYPSTPLPRKPASLPSDSPLMHQRCNGRN
jgi:hypothetical protein